MNLKIMMRYAPRAAILKLLGAVFTAVMLPLTLLFTQRLIDSVVALSQAEGDWSGVAVWGILLVVSMFLYSCTGFLETIQNIDLKRRLDRTAAYDR